MVGISDLTHHSVCHTGGHSGGRSDDNLDVSLSHNVAVIQWITSCHKNQMTTHVVTLWRVHVTSLTMSVSTMSFQIEIMFILKGIKSKWSFHMK